MTTPTSRFGLGRFAAALCAMLGAALLAPTPAQAEKTLRVVMSSDLKIIDPVWTAAYVVRDHGYMIYDTLFAMDDKGEIQPQMVGEHKISPDQLVHTLVLREGLEWHDGQPVTAEDCVASVNRWAVKDASGQVLMTFVESLSAKGAKTIEIRLKSPTGLVTTALGKPSSYTPFMMPKRVAQTDPGKQLDDPTGSGPFIFKRDEWKPGDKVVYVRNPKYKPRSEPPSGLAGGKIVKVDRVEWRAISDPQQAVNALLAGEVDFLERPTHDLLPLLKADPSITTFIPNRYGMQYAFRPNHLAKPFDDPKIREVLWYAFNQTDFLNATIGDPAYYKACPTAYPCGSAYADEALVAGRLSSNARKAQELLKAAGYDGTPIVLLHSTDLATLTNMAPVAKQLLERAGFKVDMQSMDWQTLVSRRNKKDPPAAGGWHAFITSVNGVDLLDPIMHSYLASVGDKASVGWPSDPEMEAIRAQFSREPDPGKQKALALQAQEQLLKMTQYIPLGQFYLPVAMRKGVQGVLQAPTPVFWNISLD